MAFEPGEIRKEVVACLAVHHLGQDAAELHMFAPLTEEDELKEELMTLLDMEESERTAFTVEKLRLLVAQEDFASLAEIHPAWLVEALSKESPRVIGIILRYLPSKQVRYIIEHMPKRIKQRLPQLIDSFAVPAPILKIIKQRFESQFILQKGLKDPGEVDFSIICDLKSEDLMVLFRDIGIHELAMSLKGVDRRSLNILLNRLSFEEARALQQRIRSLSDVPASLLRESKYTVLEMSLSETDSLNMLVDIGLNSFAKALSEKDVGMFPIMRQKLEPRLSYMLKRYIDQHAGSHPASISEKRKEIIFGRLVALARAGSIDEGMAGYLIASDRTVAIDLPAASENVVAPAQLKPRESESWHSDNGMV